MAIPSITAADAYHDLRGNADWSALEASEKNAALYRAQDYILHFYRLKNEIIDTDETLQNAIIILAHEFATNTPALKQAPQVESFSEELGPIKESTKYAIKGSHDPYPQLTAMLRPILAGNASGFGMAKLVN